MRTSQTALAVTILWTVFFAFSAAPGMAGEPAQSGTPVASLRIGPAGVDWLPHVDYDRLVLTVSGPGDFLIYRDFTAGQAPTFSPIDAKGDRLSDGVYAYELRVVPNLSREVRESLAKARETGDDSAVEELRKNGKLQEKTLVQSGYLSVRGGSFIDPASLQRASSKKPASKPPLGGITAKDVVQNDNLIVTGTACIGNNCTTGNGGLPLRLKDIFTQIYFEDVNDGFSFSRDWVLQANDFLGGSDHFFVADVDAGTTPFSIEGNTPNNALYVRNNGNLGLGTSTPAVRLDVKASSSGAATERLQNSSSTGYSGTEYLDNAGNVDLFFGLDNANANTRFNSINNFPIAILTNSTERMRVTSNGKIGIGTASPTEKLHVFENADVNTVLTVENPNTGLSAAGAFRAKSDSATVSFQAHGSGRTLSRFGQPLASWAEFLQVTGNGLILGTLADKPLILGTNSVNRIQVTASGDVGIGTTAPSSKLHVNGDIRVSGGSFIDDGVTLNAPDYVFEPSYSLMPLAQLREFVSREKHLPNVPTAADIKKQGLDLSKFQMRLLEKVEELALYTLAQEEHVRSLSDENQELKARLDALEKALASTEPR